MIECRYCCEDIQENAAVCIHCDAVLREEPVHEDRVQFGASVHANAGRSTSIHPDSPRVSAAQFSALKKGMSLEEVERIIGGRGVVQSEHGTPGTSLHTVMYACDGMGTDYANMNFMIQNGRLISKHQVGILAVSGPHPLLKLAFFIVFIAFASVVVGQVCDGNKNRSASKTTKNKSSQQTTKEAPRSTLSAAECRRRLRLVDRACCDECGGLWLLSRRQCVRKSRRCYSACGLAYLKGCSGDARWAVP